MKEADLYNITNINSGVYSEIYRLEQMIVALKEKVKQLEKKINQHTKIKNK